MRHFNKLKYHVITLKKIFKILPVLIPFFGFSQKGKQAIDSIIVRQQDSTKIKKVSFNGYPYIFYTPETEAAFGAGGIALFYTKKSETLRPSKIGFGAYYTSNDQYKFSIKPSIYFNSNNLVINMPVSYGYRVDKFWGIGNNTIDSGTEQYLRQDFEFELEVQVPPILLFSDRAGLIIEYKNTDIVDGKNNEFINNELVNGSKGGNIFGIGLNLLWDRRDNLFYPTSGHFQSIKFIVHPEPSDFIYTTFELDARYYKEFKKDQVFATNLYVKSVGKNAPFYELPALGGQNRMRGYFLGRYRDQTYAMLQGEYRQYFWKRFGFVAFAGIGDVGEEIINLNIGELKYSYGGGLRYLFNKKEKVNFRMDVGIGKDGNTGIYFGIEESF
ncbi:BamA/TamA family outer membrane protein [uncultured Algibacter sp.]|uniref:BamA/TamA family outer membrane protein n=1 Tax=uncultured Algibacter sp. TaxID=298659 RepID=UPI00345D347A